MKNIRFRWVCRNIYFNEIYIIDLSDEMLIKRNYPSWIETDNCEIIDKIRPTGLHDKNGKEVFEGDWFKSNSRVNPFIIIWHNGSFRGKYPQHDGEGFHIDDYETRYGEVIGNIYEDSHLLNK